MQPRPCVRRRRGDRERCCTHIDGDPGDRAVDRAGVGHGLAFARALGRAACSIDLLQPLVEHAHWALILRGWDDPRAELCPAPPHDFVVLALACGCEVVHRRRGRVRQPTDGPIVVPVDRHAVGILHTLCFALLKRILAWDCDVVVARKTTEAGVIVGLCEHRRCPTLAQREGVDFACGGEVEAGRGEQRRPLAIPRALPFEDEVRLCNMSHSHMMKGTAAQTVVLTGLYPMPSSCASWKASNAAMGVCIVSVTDSVPTDVVPCENKRGSEASV